MNSKEGNNKKKEKKEEYVFQANDELVERLGQILDEKLFQQKPSIPSKFLFNY